MTIDTTILDTLSRLELQKLAKVCPIITSSDRRSLQVDFRATKSRQT
jgi:hypothetical protein